MNYNRLRIFIAFTLVGFLYYVSPAFSQQNVSSNLSGEKTTDIGQGLSFTSIHLVSKDGNVVFKSDPGTYILDCLIKKSVPHDLLYILTDDGVVNVYDASLAGPTIDKNSIQYRGKYSLPILSYSDKYEKIIGDDLYVTSGIHVFVSRDSAATWTIDTAGIASSGSLALDTEQYVYVTNNKGLFRQDPKGNIWQLTSSQPPPHALGNLFIDRRDRFLISPTGSGMGISFSADGGKTWTTYLSSSVDLNTIRGFGDDAFGNLYAFGDTNINALGHPELYQSKGGTGPWTRIESGITKLTGNGVIFNRVGGDSILFASTNFGVFASSDQGATWIKADSGIRAETFNGFAKTASGRLVTATGLGIFRSDAGIDKWNQVYPNQGYIAGLPLYRDGKGNLFTIDASAHKPRQRYPLYKSIDEGATWQTDSIGFGSLPGDLFGGDISSSTGNLVGLYYMDELGAQHAVSTQYHASSVYVKPLGGVWTVDTLGYQQGYNTAHSMASNGHGMLFISNQLQKVVRRPIGGGAWVVDSAGISADVNHFDILTAAHDGMMYGAAVFGHDVYGHKSGSWQKITLPAKVQYPFINAISVDSNNVLFVDFKSGDGLWYTNDGGTTWTLVGFNNTIISGLYAYGDTTYATTTNGIYAITAKPGIASFSAPAIIDFGISPNSTFRDSVVTASNNGAVGLRFDSLVSNKYMFYGFGSDVPEFSSSAALELHYLPSQAGDTAILTVYSNASTSPDHITLIGRGIKNAGVVIDQSYAKIILDNPIPNPATSEMRISYSIPKHSDILLSLFDITGKEVMTIANENHDAGSYEKILDIRSFTNGSYFLKLTACGESALKVVEVMR